MVILMLSWRDPKHPLAGGAEQVSLEHAKGWISAGHKVTWFASRFRNSAEWERVEGIEIVRGGHQYLGVQLAAIFYYFKNRNEIDLMVDQFHGIPFFTPLYSRKPKLALIQEVAGKVWFLNLLPWPLNWIIGLIGFVIEPFILLFYRNVPFMTGSESAKGAVVNLGIPAKNITIVPHGVIVPKIKLSRTKSETKTVSYLGVLSKDKGVEDALRAFNILSVKKDYQFWVIGKGETKEYEEKIKTMAKNLGTKIKFWGFVSQEKKFELLSKSHILVNPSTHEGWGLVNIEANAVGTPVIAYDSAGLTDSVRNGVSGIIIEKNTPKNLAAEVSGLLENGRKYDELRKGAISWSKNFSWDYSRKKSLFLVESLINSSAIV